MFLQRLPWAGIMVKNENTSVVIDPLFNVNTGFFGEPHEAFYPLSEFGVVDAVFITHLHSDHFDPKAIQTYYGEEIPVYVPMESVETAKNSGLKNVHGVKTGSQCMVGSLVVTATYSVDGLGDPQVAWIIEGGNHRIIHCGDTLWHGYWWTIASQYGPFDVACLPVNGAVIEDPDLTPSGQPICLSPEQAVSAARILGAKTLIPIHFGAFHFPPQYVQTPDLMERLIESASNTGINLLVLQPKEWLNVLHEKSGEDLMKVK